MSDFNFITDRLAIGDVASRAVPGFVAVVSILATDRPGILADELYGAPEIPNGFKLSGKVDPVEFCRNVDLIGAGRVPWLHIDLADGEGKHFGQDMHQLEDYLDDGTAFISEFIRKGCVLVHCGAGHSRSVGLAEGFFCCYAGMTIAEASAFVEPKRPGACVAPCFKDAIRRWLKLDELAMKGPRQ